MVEYIFCKKCGKVVDEFEDFCHWCGTANEKDKDVKSESKKTAEK